MVNRSERIRKNECLKHCNKLLNHCIGISDFGGLFRLLFFVEKGVKSSYLLHCTMLLDV